MDGMYLIDVMVKLHDIEWRLNSLPKNNLDDEDKIEQKKLLSICDDYIKTLTLVMRAIHECGAVSIIVGDEENYNIENYHITDDGENNQWNIWARTLLLIEEFVKDMEFLPYPEEATSI